MDVPKLNGKNWLNKGLLYAVVVLALSVYGIVVTVQKSGGDEIITERRLATLEKCMSSLESIPTDVAGIKVSIGNLIKSVDRLEKTIDSQK